MVRHASFCFSLNSYRIRLSLHNFREHEPDNPDMMRNGAARDFETFGYGGIVNAGIAENDKQDSAPFFVADNGTQTFQKINKHFGITSGGNNLFFLGMVILFHFA
nr:MAG TPA: hypothetical protein [Bacteriophage sp.]